MTQLTAYQAAFIADRARVKSFLAGRRCGKSHALNLDAALSMCGLRVSDDGSAFEPDPSNIEGSPQYCSSLTEATAEANVAQIYANVERFARTGLLAADMWPEEPRIGSFRLKSGVECRALSSNVKVAGRSRGGDFNADEAAWVSDLDALLASALPMAGASLGRPQGYRVRFSSSAFVAGSTAHKIFVSQGGELDTWKHVSRHAVTLTEAVLEHGFPKRGMTDEEKRAYLAEREAECTPEVWAQELNNVWCSGSEGLITIEAINACRYVAAEFPRKSKKVTLGVDIARSARGNLTCLQLCTVDEDGVSWLHTPITFRGQEFSALETAILDTIESHKVNAIALDAGGLGMATAEAIGKKLAGTGVRCEQIQFTAPVKALVIESMVHRFRTNAVRVPADQGLLRDLVSLRKIAGAGAYRYTAETGADGSHADRAIAAALSLHMVGVAHGNDSGIRSAGPRSIVRNLEYAQFGTTSAVDRDREYRGPMATNSPHLFPKKGRNSYPWG